MISSSTVGTSAVQVLPPPSGKAYSFVAVGNVGPNTVYIKLVPGGDAVTTENGIPLPAGTSVVCDQDAQKELFDAGVYAIAASGASSTVSVQAH